MLRRVLVGYGALCVCKNDQEDDSAKKKLLLDDDEEEEDEEDFTKNTNLPVSASAFDGFIVVVDLGRATKKRGQQREVTTTTTKTRR